ncbi:MAG: hypothetical protein HY360_16220 [Verrucomicrobia bacterium]|nr:hypothetical protein [Verrucomicrobiota bacterium]
MKTTIDVPDPLLRQTKAHAAMKGLTVREIVIHAMENELAKENELRPDRSALSWMREWETLGKQIGRKWKTGKTAVELVREGRR